MVDQPVRLVAVTAKRIDQGRHGVIVESDKEGLCVRRGRDLVKKHVERLVRRIIQAEWRLAHLPHALPPGSRVLAAVVGVQAEAHL